MSLKQALSNATASLKPFRLAIGQTATAVGRLRKSSGDASGAVGKVKTSAGQVAPALKKMKGDADKLHASLGKLKTSATQSGGGLDKVKTAARNADGGIGKARGGADRLTKSLDKLKGAAHRAKGELQNVKRQADAVERSVGKAGKGADRTGKSMGGLGKGLKGANLAQKALNLTMAASPFGLVMALLAPLIAQFINMDKVVAVAKRGFSAAMKAISSATSSMINFIKPLLKMAVNLYTTPIRGMIIALNGAIGGLNGIKVSIPDWVPKYGGRSFGLDIPKLPNIPALAQGGLVEARTGGTLALIGEAGEAEAVLPLSKLERMFGQGGPASGAALHRLVQAVERLAERPVHVQVDSQTIARAVLVGQRQLARR
ncbi:hypothetical protein [Streptomyces zagrosensis]|uniref:Phage tail protein n=1 Tax=Streptomyces zagrosensis TaxID=1042984 RepID=A0A7W9QIW8_9ACTN|nr:hypothetical protein [Streptomyces zagrosensis]MBB5940077.1 hypothetical protein [Streptomyces zagrosensis]